MPAPRATQRRVSRADEDAPVQQNIWADAGARTLHLLSQASRLAKDGEQIRNSLTLYREGETVEQDMTPQNLLLAAARVGDVTAIKQQVVRGTNLDLSSELFGETALCTAAARGHGTVVNVLLEAGAQVDRADRAGWTALMWAASHGHSTILRRLLESGASSIARGNGGKTALDLAKVTQKVECILALRAWSAGSRHEHCAASRIQATQRGRSARRHRKTQADAATRIQALHRGKVGRRSTRARHQARLAEQRARLGSEEEHRAATRLQALQRGRATRQRVAAAQRAQRKAGQRKRVAAARRAAKRAALHAARARLHHSYYKGTKKEHSAATRLQAAQRGCSTRRRMARDADKHRAATRLQARQRGRSMRRRMVEEKRAATKIQARQRGRRGRREFARRPEVLLREMTVMASRLGQMEDEFSVRCWGMAPLR